MVMLFAARGTANAHGVNLIEGVSAARECLEAHGIRDI